MTDIRDADQLKYGNHESQYPGEWTPVNLVPPKRPRETLTDLEHMESDELHRMGTGSRANQTKSDQPEEESVKEQRVEDVAMDQEPQDASLTKMRMDEMLMDQAMAVSCGTSRVCVKEEKYEPATMRGLPRRSRQEAREMKDLDDMNVLEWVRESTVPRDARILDCGWAMKMKSPPKCESASS